MNIILPWKHQVKPVRIDRIDFSHPLTDRLRAAIPVYNEIPIELVRQQIGDVGLPTVQTQYGTALKCPSGIDESCQFGDIPAYDTTGNMTAAVLLDVRSWTTATSGDWLFQKDQFNTRGWQLLNNGTFVDQVGFRTGYSGGSNYAAVTRATIGTGFMLMAGRRTGTTIQLVRCNASGASQLASTAEATGMATPAGVQLMTSTTSGNGDVRMLCFWLWDYYLSNDQLLELFRAPWQMFTPRSVAFGKAPAAVAGVTYPQLERGRRGVCRGVVIGGF